MPPNAPRNSSPRRRWRVRRLRTATTNRCCRRPPGRWPDWRYWLWLIDCWLSPVVKCVGRTVQKRIARWIAPPHCSWFGCYFRPEPDRLTHWIGLPRPRVKERHWLPTHWGTPSPKRCWRRPIGWRYFAGYSARHWRCPREPSIAQPRCSWIGCSPRGPVRPLRWRQLRRPTEKNHCWPRRPRVRWKHSDCWPRRIGWHCFAAYCAKHLPRPRRLIARQTGRTPRPWAYRGSIDESRYSSPARRFRRHSRRWSFVGCSVRPCVH